MVIINTMARSPHVVFHTPDDSLEVPVSQDLWSIVGGTKTNISVQTIIKIAILELATVFMREELVPSLVANCQ